MNKSQQAFLKLLEREEKIAVLLAPSFIVDFDYPDIIAILKDLSVSLVTEITYGAYLINQIYNHYILQNSNQRYFINTTCPTVVQYIKHNYPSLEKYLFPEISCVMAFIRYFHTVEPEHNIVFVSPCIAKRDIEEKKIEEWNLSLTFKELKEILDLLNVDFAYYRKKYKNKKLEWDNLTRVDTKLYPLDAGQSLTANWKELFPDFNIYGGSSIIKLKEILNLMKNHSLPKSIIDFTACPGSCINGPGISSKSLSIDKRKAKVVTYFQKFIK